jgi:cell division protein FtsB
MNLIVELKSRARHVVGPMLGVSAVIYFAYHAVNGERGLMAWLELKDRVAAAEAAAETVGFQRRRIETWVRLLHPESLDPDLLEERARVMLNYAHSGDIVILVPRTETQMPGPKDERRSIR